MSSSPKPTTKKCHLCKKQGHTLRSCLNPTNEMIRAYIMEQNERIRHSKTEKTKIQKIATVINMFNIHFHYFKDFQLKREFYQITHDKSRLLMDFIQKQISNPQKDVIYTKCETIFRIYCRNYETKMQMLLQRRQTLLRLFRHLLPDNIMQNCVFPFITITNK